MKDLGKRIKELRNQRGMILTELGERTNLSASYLSQIERDKATPSLATLSSIAEALDVELRYFFETDAEPVYIVRSDARQRQQAPDVRMPCTRLTADGSGWKIEVHRLTLQPDTPGPQCGPGQGEVLTFVLEGELAVTLGDEEYVLAEGDSIHYDANQPYRLHNKADTPCIALWCNSPPRQHE